MESIRIGSKGSEVKRLQELLRQHGFKEVEGDGEFGTKTNQAVIKFKKKKGLLAKNRVLASPGRDLSNQGCGFRFGAILGTDTFPFVAVFHL